MELYVLQKRGNYYSCTMPRGSLIYSEHLKNAHFFGEVDRREAETFAEEHHCKLVRLECSASVVLDAEGDE